MIPSMPQVRLRVFARQSRPVRLLRFPRSIVGSLLEGRILDKFPLH